MKKKTWFIILKKSLNCLLFILIVLLKPFSYANQYHNVKFVIDGDTIMLSNRNLVRYIGIDCPEISYKTSSAASLGFEAKKANRTLITENSIHLEYDNQKKDHYGRILAYAYTADGTFINNEMIKKGYAWVLYKKPNIKYNKEFLVSQRLAMSKKLGIWKDWKEKDGIHYIGNIKSKRFHTVNCPYGKQTTFSNRYVFHRKWDAFYAGFSPCKKCILSKTGE